MKLKPLCAGIVVGALGVGACFVWGAWPVLRMVGAFCIGCAVGVALVASNVSPK